MRLEDSSTEDKEPRNLDKDVIDNEVYVETGEATARDVDEDEVDYKPHELDDAVEISQDANPCFKKRPGLQVEEKQ